MSFNAFCAHLGVGLTPGQLELTRVAYDGEEPRGSRLWGGVEDIPPACRRVFVARCGGRAGKSYVLGALRLLWGALVRDLSALAPGQQAVALIVAPDLRLARETLRYVRGALQSDESLRGLVINETVDTITIRRDDGQVVSFEALPATRGGSALRGRWLTDALLDEAAFFRDADYAVNDVEVFRAVVPRVLPGGQVLMHSTPWADEGLHHEEWSRNFGHPTTAMAALATTLDLLDTPEMRALVEAETLRDPDNAAREFGAQTMSGAGAKFFAAALLESCVDGSLALPRTPLPGEMVTAGGDLAFRRDSAALVIAHRGARIVVAEVEELIPDAGAPLRPSEVVGRFGARILAHGGAYLMADGHYRETVVEHLEPSGIGYLPAPTTPADAFVSTRQAMREGMLVLPRHPRLLAQLRDVVLRPTPGGGLTVVLPRRPGGGHGDLASALVLAVHQSVGEVVPAPAPRPGTREHEEAEREARRLRAVRERDVPWWRRGR